MYRTTIHRIKITDTPYVQKIVKSLIDEEPQLVLFRYSNFLENGASITNYKKVLYLTASDIVADPSATVIRQRT